MPCLDALFWDDSHREANQAISNVSNGHDLTTGSIQAIELRTYWCRLTTPCVERKLIGHLRNFTANVVERGIVIALIESLRDPASDLPHLRFLHAARGKRGRADANARRLERRIGVIRNGVLVHGDAGLAEGEFGFRAEDALGEDIHED